MLVVQSFHPGDIDQALRFARWTEELGGVKGHELLLMPDTSCAPAVVEEIRQSFARSFDAVEVLPFVDHFRAWPASPNAIFSMAARHIMRTRPQPWLFCEPDCVPMAPGWLDALEAEYQAAGKPFLGDFVSVHTPELDVPDHMSGNAIYPADMFAHAGTALIAGDTAWDVVSAEQVLPQMQTSALISHAWKHPTFANMEQVQREIFAIKPECVLFHASKDGSLIDILRAERNKTLPISEEYMEAIRKPSPSFSREAVDKLLPISPSPVHNQRSSEATSTGGGLICDILIKSYPPDYELLRYCLRSIEKFATGFRRVVLIVPKPKDDEHSFNTGFISDKAIKIESIEVEEQGEGYLFQQAVKINAHEYTDADYILHIDSDTMLIKPVTPQTFFREVIKSGLGSIGPENRIGSPVTEKRPLWLMTPYAVFEKELHDNPGLLLGVMAWKPITEKFIGEPVEFEFMRRPPMLIPRSLHVSADVFCRVRHKMSLAQYILSQPHRAFSEFNALGALAYSRARDEFSWLDTTKEELPELVAIQRWSHEPLTDEIRAELEAILSGADGLTAVQPLAVKARPIADDPPAQAIRQTAAGHWIINGDTHISAWVEEKGQLQHDFQTLPLILAEINEGDVVVDVGANIGDSTAPFLERVGPKGFVIAFEPNEDAYECLRRNCPTAICYAAALDQYNGKTFGTLLPNSNAGARFIGKSESGQPVEMRTLDHYELDKCDFIKIDVEGYELNVLRGAEQTISKFRPKMAIEINEGALKRQGTSTYAIYNWLHSHGYKFWPLVTPNLEQDDPQFDILCRPIPGITSISLEEPRACSENLQTTLVPWESKPESIEKIRRLCARLKEFETCPAYTALVRRELKIAKVTK